MLKAELLEIISYGENSGVEFKRDDIRPEQLAREAVALCNLQGGRIFLGVEDDGTISGLQRKNSQEWVLNVFRDKVHQQIIPFYEEVIVEPGKKVGVVTLGPGISKPYVVRHNNREEIYVRMGNRSELASREQQLRLFESGGLVHVEVLPVPGSGFRDLDKARLDSYLKSVIEDPEVPGSNQEWVDRLIQMGLMAEDGQGNRVCSIAGMLCFGVRPRRFLPQSGIRLMAFEGMDKDYKARLDTVVAGPMTGRWDRDETGRARLVDEGVIEKFAAQIEPFIKEEESEIDEGFRRNRILHYPREVVRETVLNALAHRDWTKSGDIEVAVYADRMEVTSPGKLQNAMTVEKMVAGQRSPRNPMIMDILRDYGYVDARGMGVRTKIIPLMRRHNNTEPKFEATEDYLRTTLYRKPKEAQA